MSTSFFNFVTSSVSLSMVFSALLHRSLDAIYLFIIIHVYMYIVIYCTCIHACTYVIWLTFLLLPILFSCDDLHPPLLSPAQGSVHCLVCILDYSLLSQYRTNGSTMNGDIELYPVMYMYIYIRIHEYVCD